MEHDHFSGAVGLPMYQPVLPGLNPGRVDWHDFAHIKDWVFDLDNTLYPASAGLFDQMSRLMGTYIAANLKIPLSEARHLQKGYFRKYGITLRGLMLEKGIDPDHFLSVTHELDLSRVQPRPDMAKALNILPGRKLIFTNGPEHHAVNLLAHLQISDCFDGIFDIKAADYQAKPADFAYERFMERFDVRGDTACMIEDTARNLPPARLRGMTTVWVNGAAEWAQPDLLTPTDSSIQHVIQDAADWLVALADSYRHYCPPSAPRCDNNGDS